jgi:hypothetical protein
VFVEPSRRRSSRFRPGVPGLDVSTCQGPVWIEGCSMRGLDGSPLPFLTHGRAGIRVSQSDAVVLVRTVGSGGDGSFLSEETTDPPPGKGGAGLMCLDSTVAVLGGTFLGGRGGSIEDTVTYTGGAGGAGVFVTSGSIGLAGTVGSGGFGGYADEDNFFGLCGDGGAGGDGLSIGLGGAATVRDATLTGGAGGAEGSPVWSCSDGPDGVPIGVSGGSTSTPFPAIHQALVGNSPVREGETLTLTFSGDPGQIVLYTLGTSAANLPVPQFQGTSLLASAAPLKLAGLLNLDGKRTLQVQPSDLVDPGTALSLYLQGVFYDVGTQAVTLGGGTAVTFLDATD